MNSAPLYLSFRRIRVPHQNVIRAKKRPISLQRIRFAGTRNLGLAAALQSSLVRPGRYRFCASIRTDGLTTDQGVGFRVLDE